MGLVDASGSVLGAICDSPCQTDSDCPTDKPAGGSAVPRCNLQDQDTGASACGLACGTFKKCPDGASCSGGLLGGVCYWPETNVAAAGRKQVKSKTYAKGFVRRPANGVRK